MNAAEVSMADATSDELKGIGSDAIDERLCTSNAEERTTSPREEECPSDEDWDSEDDLAAALDWADFQEGERMSMIGFVQIIRAIWATVCFFVQSFILDSER